MDASYPMSRSVSDQEALRVQIEAMDAHAAWQTCRNWDDFDKLSAELQELAWQQLANDAANRSEGIGIYQQAIAPPKPAPPPKRTWNPAKIARSGRDLDSIPTEEYVQTLAGQEVQLRRAAPCPFPDHEDNSPSFHAYEDGHFNCFGCNRGGTIFQFAAHLWGYGIPLRGDVFREVRDRLHDHLG